MESLGERKVAQTQLLAVVGGLDAEQLEVIEVVGVVVVEQDVTPLVDAEITRLEELSLVELEAGELLLAECSPSLCRDMAEPPVFPQEQDVVPPRPEGAWSGRGLWVGARARGLGAGAWGRARGRHLGSITGYRQRLRCRSLWGGLLDGDEPRREQLLQNLDGDRARQPAHLADIGDGARTVDAGQKEDGAAVQGGRAQVYVRAATRPVVPGPEVPGHAH